MTWTTHFEKKIITNYMNSDGDKFYMKIVDLDEIYNFVVQTVFIWSLIVAKITNKSFKSKI